MEENALRDNAARSLKQRGEQRTRILGGRAHNRPSLAVQPQRLELLDVAISGRKTFEPTTQRVQVVLADQARASPPPPTNWIQPGAVETHTRQLCIESCPLYIRQGARWRCLRETHHQQPFQVGQRLPVLPVVVVSRLKVNEFSSKGQVYLRKQQ